MMGIQQHPTERRGPMEGGIHYPPWTLQTNGHVLRILQHTSHLLGVHEPHLCRHDRRKVA